VTKGKKEELSHSDFYEKTYPPKCCELLSILFNEAEDTGCGYQDAAASHEGNPKADSGD